MDIQQPHNDPKVMPNNDENANWAMNYARPSVVENRPDELDCDVVRFQNNREKWVAFVGLLDGRPYERSSG